MTSVYRSAEELRMNPPVADVFVVGSDQVWNPSITKAFGTESFFLDFVPQGCRKIAYAASFGTSMWASIGKEKDTEIRRLVNEFEAVSVRELDGVKICNMTFGRKDVVPVIDPVFLLEDYTPIIGTSNRQKGEVVCYPLCTNEETKYVLREVSSDLKLVPVSFSRSISGGDIKLRLFSSIPGWLKAIACSQFIVTNSFHCMAFCILFRKPFIMTPPLSGRESRILSMLRQLAIENRYITSIADFQARKTAVYEKIDYEKVNENLNALRRESLIFLLNNL